MGMNQVLNFLSKLQKAKYYKGNIERVTSKKIKRYPIHKTVLNKNKIFQKFKYTNLEGFKSHFGINKTNRIVGYTPDYIGINPSNVIYNNNSFLKFVYNKFDIIEKDFSNTFLKQLKSSSSDTRINYSRGYNTVHSHLKEFLKDNTTTIKSDDILRLIHDNGICWFNSPKVHFYSKYEIDYYIRYNEQASPGHYTSKLVSNKKINTNIASRIVAKRLYSVLLKQPMKNFYLWSVLGREKDIKLVNTQEDKFVGSRLILSTEDPMSTLLMWFSQKIQLSLRNSPNSTFNVYGEFDADKAQRLRSYEKLYDFKLDADWEFFDSNCDTEFILAACALLLDGLPKDSLHKRIKYLITKSLITKYIAVPPGVVVELNRGVPSGHPFTTLINCTINTIYWSLIGYKIYGKHYTDNMRIEVYGDDTYAYFKYNDNLFKIDQYIKELGLKSEKLCDKLRFCNFDYNDHELPDFLKRRFNETTIKWNYKKMFDKLFYQSKRRGLEQQIELLISFYVTAPLDTEFYNFIKLYYNYLIEVSGSSDLYKIDSFLNLEELVNQGPNNVDRFKRFNISYINFINCDFLNKFSNLLKFSGNFLKLKYYVYRNEIPNLSRVDLLYYLAFPPDFSVKNKLIHYYDEDLIYYYRFGRTYIRKRWKFIGAKKALLNKRILKVLPSFS